jgi:hypothetical protein
MGRIPVTHCLLGVALAFVLLLALGVQAGTILVVGAALLCPLMMVLMMGGMARGMAHGRDGHGAPREEHHEDPDHTTGAPSS